VSDPDPTSVRVVFIGDDGTRTEFEVPLEAVVDRATGERVSVEEMARRMNAAEAAGQPWGFDLKGPVKVTPDDS
jgi:hypothetical protein